MLNIKMPVVSYSADIMFPMFINLALSVSMLQFANKHERQSTQLSLADTNRFLLIFAQKPKKELQTTFWSLTTQTLQRHQHVLPQLENVCKCGRAFLTVEKVFKHPQNALNFVCSIFHPTL